MRRRALLGVAAVALALALAACGEDSAGSGTTAAGAPVPELTTWADTAIGTVVVDADGMTLYTTEREDGGEVACLDECVEVWPPAIVGSASPTVSDELADRVGTVERPDGGGLQATFDGRPLYRFGQDGGPGETNGEGVEDAFGGAGFAWHAAIVDGAATPPPPTTAPAVVDPYGY